MQRKTLTQTIRLAAAGTLAASVSLAPLSHGAARTAHAAASPVYLTSYAAFHTTFSARNFNPFLIATQLDFTRGAIYEPLEIMTTAGGGRTYPWLATGYTFTDGNKTLLVTIRHNVRWSDGTLFSAKDVAFTYNYGKQYPAADQTGLWGAKQLVSVNQVGSDKVALRFRTVDTTIVQQALSNVSIVPQRIWSKVTNPSTFTNSNPIGTGPFARVREFTAQEYILGKNRYYWQAGKPAFDGIRVPAYTDNNSALAAAIKGDVDWAGVFVPNAQRAYVRFDPTHYHYFYAANNPPIALYFDDQKAPYNSVAFRKAISYAINRSDISKIGENGYEPASDAIGIAAAYPTWVDPSLAAQAKDLATYNPTKAKQTLTAAGFTYKSGKLYDPQGKPVTVELNPVIGFTDWVSSFQIIQQNLQAIGIDAPLKQIDPTVFFDKRAKGLMNAFFGAPSGGVSPYNYFNSYLSAESYVPTGQDATANGDANFERYNGSGATQASQLLAQFRSTTDSAKQHALLNQLQKIQLDQLPIIPLMNYAYWYTYSTKNFTGFPDQNNYYAIGSSYQYPDNLKILTTITPVG